MNTQKITPQILKGFRDFLPNIAIKRNYVIEKLKIIFEQFGFDPLETPALEYAETLLGKYGNEADKLLYLFEDRGKRKVGLRYDQTVPLARVIAQYKNQISFPFKRYQIQPVWRADNTQKGRYREFLQCDIDTVGAGGIYADAEIISCVIKATKNLGFKNVKMIINDRSVFVNLKPEFIVSIDKLAKIGKNGVVKELINKGMSKDQAEKFINSFDKTKPTPHIISLFKILASNGLKENEDFEFDPTLARGLDYYTSTIYELICMDYSSGSIGGGGRYDKLIGQFIGNNIPAVGFAFGFDRLLEAMEILQLLPTVSSSTKVFVTIFSDELLQTSIDLVSILRNNNINTDINLDSDLRLDEQLKYANKKSIPYVVIIGPEEVASGKVVLKDMKTGEQFKLTQEELVNKLCK